MLKRCCRGEATDHPSRISQKFSQQIPELNSTTHFSPMNGMPSGSMTNSKNKHAHTLCTYVVSCLRSSDSKHNDQDSTPQNHVNDLLLMIFFRSGVP